MYNSVGFSIFRVGHPSHCILQHFCHPKKKPHALQQPFSQSTPLPPWQPLVCFVSVYLPILETSQEWNHTVCSLLYLVSFNQHNVDKVRPYCSTCQYFMLFYGSVVSHCMGTTNTFYLPTHQMMDTWVVSTLRLL